MNANRMSVISWLVWKSCVALVLWACTTTGIVAAEPAIRETAQAVAQADALFAEENYQDASFYYAYALEGVPGDMSVINKYATNVEALIQAEMASGELERAQQFLEQYRLFLAEKSFAVSLADVPVIRERLNAAEAMQNSLATVQTELSDRESQAELERVVTGGKQYVQTASLELPQQDLEEVAYIITYLEQLDPQSGAAVGSLELVKKLQEVLVHQRNQSVLREFENRWRRLRNLRDSNPKVFSVGLTSLYSSVAETAAAIEIAGWDYSEYEELASELLSGIRYIKTLEERAFANSMRKYQRWALDNIKIFTTNTDTDNLNRKIDNLIKCVRGETQFRYLDWHDEVPEISAFVASIDYKKEPGSIYGENETFLYNNTSFKLDKIREECGHAILSAFMIKRLIPIDTTNLELPVLEMYQNAFENAWGLLDTTLYQIAVAESTVETVKVTPAAFWEAMK